MRYWKSLLIGSLAACLLMGGCAAFAETGTLTLPRSTRTIGERAFYGDASLDDVTLPDGLTRIEADAFAGSSVRSINLPDTITYIADTAFDQSALESVSATEGSYAHAWAVEKGYILPPNPASDFDYEIADGKCTITSYRGASEVVLIPSSIEGSSVTDIGEEAFYDCRELTRVTLPNSVTHIGRYAFYACASLTRVTLPDGVASIGSFVFAHCAELTRVTLPGSVTSIGVGPFSACKKLEAIYGQAGSYAERWAGMFGFSFVPI